jgi:hypothetical protein
VGQQVAPEHSIPADKLLSAVGKQAAPEHSIPADKLLSAVGKQVAPEHRIPADKLLSAVGQQAAPEHSIPADKLVSAIDHQSVPEHNIPADKLLNAVGQPLKPEPANGVTNETATGPATGPANEIATGPANENEIVSERKVKHHIGTVLGKPQNPEQEKRLIDQAEQYQNSENYKKNSENYKRFVDAQALFRKTLGNTYVNTFGNTELEGNTESKDESTPHVNEPVIPVTVQNPPQPPPVQKPVTVQNPPQPPPVQQPVTVQNPPQPPPLQDERVNERVNERVIPVTVQKPHAPRLIQPVKQGHLKSMYPNGIKHALEEWKKNPQKQKGLFSKIKGFIKKIKGNKEQTLKRKDLAQNRTKRLNQNVNSPEDIYYREHALVQGEASNPSAQETIAYAKASSAWIDLGLESLRLYSYNKDTDLILIATNAFETGQSLFEEVKTSRDNAFRYIKSITEPKLDKYKDVYREIMNKRKEEAFFAQQHSCIPIQLKIISIRKLFTTPYTDLAEDFHKKINEIYEYKDRKSVV